MLHVAYIRDHREELIERLSIRNLDAASQIDQAINLDKQYRLLKGKLDEQLAEANSMNKQIGELFQAGKADEAGQIKAKTTTLKEQNKVVEEQLKTVNEQLQQLLYDIPNAPHSTVPKGKTSEDNEIVYENGNLPELGQDAKAHWDLAEKYNIIDFNLGNKITGAGFPVYLGKGARLQRALIQMFLDDAVQAGYQEIQPPLLVNEDSGYGTGQLPDKEAQMYELKDDKYYLIPTAEVPLTNLYRDTILKAEELPVRMVGYTACFRREAGSYGKDVRGLNRLHQFDKVEIVQITRPDESYQVLEQMVEYVKGLLAKLELPFRVAKLCGGDLGFAAAMTYDMEVYSGAQQKWLEVSSISNFESFQTNRMKLRYRDQTGKPQLAHTLNGSALALPRIVAALLENNQSSDGIKIPSELVNYTGFDIIN